MSNIESLVKKFHKLSADEQQILLSLAVLFAPVGQTRLQEILRALNCVEPRVYKQVAKPLREKLENEGFIVISSDGWCCVTGGLSETLVRIAFQEYPDLFAKLAKFCLADRNYVPQHLKLIYQVRSLRFFLYAEEVEKFSACFPAWKILFLRMSCR